MCVYVAVNNMSRLKKEFSCQSEKPFDACLLAPVRKTQRVQS